ncbi:DUF2971 domain-containing protein [Chelativorans sp.]
MWANYADNHRGICLEFDKVGTAAGGARGTRHIN